MNGFEKKVYRFCCKSFFTCDRVVQVYLDIEGVFMKFNALFLVAVCSPVTAFAMTHDQLEQCTFQQKYVNRLKGFYQRAGIEQFARAQVSRLFPEWVTLQGHVAILQLFLYPRTEKQNKDAVLQAFAAHHGYSKKIMRKIVNEEKVGHRRFLNSMVRCRMNRPAAECFLNKLQASLDQIDRDTAYNIDPVSRLEELAKKLTGRSSFVKRSAMERAIDTEEINLSFAQKN